MNEHNQNGALLSLEDKRDWDIAAAGIASHERVQDSSYPVNYMCEHLPARIYDQGSWPMCVGFAMAAAKETLDNKEGVEGETRCSPGFSYAEREDDDHQGDGMRPREALKVLQKIGTCAWSLFPNSGDYPEIKNILRAKPNYNEIVEEAYKHSISAYYRIYTLEEIKYTLMEIGPVLISVPSYTSDYWNHTTGEMRQGPDSHCTGAHAMLIVGWKDNDILIIRNSWGENWGDHGHGFFKFGEHQIHEMWAITDRMTPEIEQYYKCKAGQHIYSDWEWIKEETCDSYGEMKRICSACGKEEYMQVVPLGHTFGFWECIRKATTKKPARYKRTCSVCGKTEYENRDEEPPKNIWSQIIDFFKGLINIFISNK